MTEEWIKNHPEVLKWPGCAPVFPARPVRSMSAEAAHWLDEKMRLSAEGLHWQEEWGLAQALPVYPDLRQHRPHGLWRVERGFFTQYAPRDGRHWHFMHDLAEPMLLRLCMRAGITNNLVELPVWSYSQVVRDEQRIKYLFCSPVEGVSLIDLLHLTWELSHHRRQFWAQTLGRSVSWPRDTLEAEMALLELGWA